MSAFGYGSSYNPGQSGTMPSSVISQTVPGYTGGAGQYGGGTNGDYSAGDGGVNWGMAAGNPLSGWGTMITSYDVNQHGGVQGWIDQGAGNRGSVTAERKRLAYSNPLNGLTGTGGMLDLGDNIAAGQYQLPTWSNKQFVAGGSSGFQAGGTEATMPIQSYAAGTDPYKNEFGTDAADPNSLQGLYSRVNNLGGSQLQTLSNNLGSRGSDANYKPGASQGAPSGLFGAFQQAQQGYADDYANADWRRANPMDQQSSLNWLQASYNSLTNNLNANGLL